MINALTSLHADKGKRPRKIKCTVHIFRRIPTWGWLIIILLLSLSLKLLCRHFNPMLSRDSGLYVRLIREWYEYGNFCGLAEWDKFYFPPLPLFLAKTLMGLHLSAETAGILLNLTLGTFTPLLTAGIAYEITRKKHPAVFSALLTAVAPAINHLSADVLREIPYFFFSGLALWFTAKGIRQKKWYWWPMAAIAVACAVFSRFEAIEFLLLIPLSLVCLRIARHFSWKQVLGYGSIFFLSFFIFVFSMLCFMRKQNALLPDYKNYYQTRWHSWSEKIQPVLKGAPR